MSRLCSSFKLIHFQEYWSVHIVRLADEIGSHSLHSHNHGFSQPCEHMQWIIEIIENLIIFYDRKWNYNAEMDCLDQVCCAARTPSIVKGNKSLSLVWSKWGSQWRGLVLDLESSSMCCNLPLVEWLLGQWGVLKDFPQSRCIFNSHWSREK